MKHPWPLALSLAIGLLFTIPANGKSLKGQVLMILDGDRNEPASPAQVSIVGIGNPDVTNKDGGFTVLLPDVYQPDDPITLYVEFERGEWVMSEPIGGDIRLPKNPAQTLVKILLVPKGATELHAPAQIAKVMEKTLEESLDQVAQDGKADDFDPFSFAREWARKNGVPEHIILDRLRTLKNQYAHSNDLSKQGIAAIFNKHPDQAAENFTQSANQKEQTREELLRQITRLRNSQSRHRKTKPSSIVILAEWQLENTGVIRNTALEDNERQLKDLEQQLRRVTDEIVEDLRKAGNAHYLNYDFQKARQSYQKALTYATKKSYPTLWASLLINLGNTNWEIAIRTKGKAIRIHFEEAHRAYSQAEQVYSRETFLRNWAATRMGSGNTLSGQGRRATGTDSQRLLTAAVAAYRAALEVYTRQSLPLDWARTQVNLGTALWDQSTRTTGTDSQRLLAAAVAAYRAALEVYTRQSLPQDWAETQMSLGNVLADQGRRATGTDSQRLLAAAVAAYRAALEVYTRQTLPQDWAETQMGLGNVLADQGSRATGPEKQRLLQEMVTAMGLSLEIFTREFFPSGWGMARSKIVEARFLLNEWKLVTQDVAILLPDPYITEASKVALQVLLILALDGEGERDSVPTALEGLRTRVTSQPPGFLMTWSFEAVKQFLRSQTQFASSRDWALKLIQAVERHGREHILQGLDSVITQYATLNQ